MAKPAGAIPGPQLVPVFRGKFLLGALRPGHIMSPIVGWQIDPIRLMVRRDNWAKAIEDIVLTQILLVDAQHVGRSSRVDFGAIVEAEAINVAEIACLTDP